MQGSILFLPKMRREGGGDGALEGGACGGVSGKRLAGGSSGGARRVVLTLARLEQVLVALPHAAGWAGVIALTAILLLHACQGFWTGRVTLPYPASEKLGVTMAAL